MINIKQIKSANFKGFTFIEGFPGVGLVGPMAISYIIDKLGMEYVGYLESSSFPPLISIHKNTPMPPVRLYASAKDRVVTIFAEFAIPMELILELSDVVYKFIRDNNIASFYSIGGMPMQEGKDKGVFVLTSTPELLKDAQKAGLKPIVEGVATGVSALLLSRAAQENFPATSIMVPVELNIIDPGYAEQAVESLNKLMKLNIDTSDLEREAKEVEAKVRELISKHRETHDSYKKATTESGPSMYA